MDAAEGSAKAKKKMHRMSTGHACQGAADHDTSDIQQQKKQKKKEESERQ
jgi:hypothetical protein